MAPNPAQLAQALSEIFEPKGFQKDPEAFASIGYRGAVAGRLVRVSAAPGQAHTSLSPGGGLAAESGERTGQIPAMSGTGYGIRSTTLNCNARICKELCSTPGANGQTKTFGSRTLLGSSSFVVV